MGSTDELIGRTAVLHELRGALDSVARGTGSLVLLSGEAGMGKSAVLAAVSALASSRGWRVHRGLCVAGDVAPPLWPWTQVLRTMINGQPAPSQWLVDRLTGSLGQVTGRPADDSSDRFRLRDEIAETLASQSLDRPLLIMIDDLHWADAESAALLGFLGRRLDASAVLLLVAGRDEPDVSTTVLAPVLSSVAGTIVLSGLAESEVANLITRTQGYRPDTDTSADVARRTGGNPFFVRELTRLSLTSGGWTRVGSGQPKPIPLAIRSTIRERLDSLSTDTRELLEAAAVVGMRVEGEVLRGALDRSTEEVDRRAEPAVLARVLRLAEDGDGWVFTHDLYREVLVGDLPPARRRTLHAAVGTALSQTTGIGPENVAASRVARHLSLGGESVRRQARAYAIMAAAEATRRFAHTDAVRHLELAIRLTETAEVPGRLELLIELSASQRRAGDRMAAERLLRQVINNATDASTLAQATLGLVDLEVRSGVAVDENVALLQAAIDRLDPSEAATMSRLQAALARELARADHGEPARRLQQARQASERAVALADRLGDPTARAAARTTALLAQHDVAWLPGTAAGRLPIIDALIESAAAAADPDLLAEAIGLRSAALIEVGDPAGVRELWRFVEHAERLGNARGRWAARSRRATLATISGDLGQAESRARSALELGTDIGIPDAFGCFGTTMVSIAVQGGSVPPVNVPEDDPVSVLAPLINAVISPDHDHRAAVRTVAVSVLPSAPDLEARATAAVAYAAWGTREQCDELYGQLVRHAGSHVVVGGCAAFYGPVDYYLGRLALALGRHEIGQRHLVEARDLARGLGAGGWSARATEGGPLVRTEGLFVHNGATWQLTYRGREVHLPDAKGLQDLAVLLAHPGVDVHVFTLVGRAEPATGSDPVLDHAAKTHYLRRLTELEATMADADISGDPVASERAAVEQAALHRELAAAVGLQGRDRRLGDQVERVRKTVSARVRDALGRVEDVHPDLAAHLRSSVTLGVRCAYRPAEPTRWRLTV